MAKPFFTAKNKTSAAVMIPAVRKLITTWRTKFFRLFTAKIRVPEFSTSVLGMREAEEALKMIVNHARQMTNKAKGGFAGNPGDVTVDEDGNVTIQVFRYSDYYITLYRDELGGVIIHTPELTTDINGAVQLHQCVGQAVQLGEGMRA